MNWLSRLTILRSVCLVSAMALTAGDRRSDAADRAKIQQAILRSQQYLLQQKLSGPQGCIGAMAYIKSGGDKKASAVEGVLQEVLRKFRDGSYFPSHQHIYEAGVDLMLLEAIDGEAYRPQMEAIVAYLLYNQQPNGSWYYPVNIQPYEPDCGDTSITQYALLGLWAASRVGIEIPTEAWERSAARWAILPRHTPIWKKR